jgi:hypothetical protein
MGVGGVDPDLLPFSRRQLADADPEISLSSLAIWTPAALST